jgi:hypothetical protein
VGGCALSAWFWVSPLVLLLFPCAELVVDRGDDVLRICRRQDHRSRLDRNHKAHQEWAAQLPVLVDAYLAWKLEVMLVRIPYLCVLHLMTGLWIRISQHHCIRTQQITLLRALKVVINLMSWQSTQNVCMMCYNLYHYSPSIRLPSTYCQSATLRGAQCHTHSCGSPWLLAY